MSVCLSVCLSGYRLGSWKCYNLETGIIGTSMTWGCAMWKKFSRKVTSGRVTEEKSFATNAFLWEKFVLNRVDGWWMRLNEWALLLKWPLLPKWLLLPEWPLLPNWPLLPKWLLLPNWPLLPKLLLLPNWPLLPRWLLLPNWPLLPK